MSTLSNDAHAGGESSAVWLPCTRCGVLFAASPDQARCRDCDAEAGGDVSRCEAAHPEDRSPCDGAPDAVRVVDQVGDQLCGCVHHASVVLASVEGARVYPGSDGAVVEAITRAQLREPFAFDPVGPWPVAATGPAGGGEW